MKTIYNKLAAAVLGFGLIAGSSHAQYITPIPGEIPYSSAGESVVGSGGFATGGLNIVDDINDAFSDLDNNLNGAFSAVGDADTAIQDDVDQNEADADAAIAQNSLDDQLFATNADTAQTDVITTAYTDADTAQTGAITTAYTDADTAQTGVITTAYTDADTAQTGVITTAYTDADTAQTDAITTAYTDADTAQTDAITTAYTDADTANSLADQAYTDALRTDLRESWADTIASVGAVGAGDLTEVIDMVDNLGTYITDEGNYRAKLVLENSANDDAIVAADLALVDANDTVAAAIIASDTADEQVVTAEDAVEAAIPGSPEFFAALDALDLAIANAAAFADAEDAAELAVIEASDAVDAANARKVAIEASIVRSDDRVTAAEAAQTTITDAVAAKNVEFAATTAIVDSFTDGITSDDGTVNDLDDLISAIAAVATDEDGIDVPVDAGALPVADDGFDTSTAYLTDLANDPASVDAYIASATASLDSITSALTSAEQGDILDAMGNGSFEREAITEIASGGIDGIITLEDDGTIHIGENSFIFDDTVGAHVLTTDDATGPLTIGGGAVTEVDVAAALSTNGELVATQTYADAGDSAIQADVDANETASDLADAAIQADVDANELAATNAIAAVQADVDANETASIAADVAIQADVDANETASIAADAAIQADVDANELSATNAIAAVQADVDANEAASDLADDAITDAFTLADTAIQADVDQNEADADAAIALNSVTDQAFATAGDAAVTAAFTAADANLQSQINVNSASIARNARGIAMAAALVNTTVLPGMTHALDISASHFEGETGMAISYSRRVKDGVQVNFAAASTSDMDESIVRGGIGWQW